MKMIVTRNRELEVIDGPEALIKPGFVLVETVYSAVSPGTEVTIKNRENQVAAPLGYSASGIVLEVGEGVKDLQIGQRVACYGGPYVRHAERLVVPKHLVVPVPDHVDMKHAAFVGLGAIGIHALRQGGLQFGETAVITGLGILGQLMAQIANQAGYRVIGCDLLEARCQMLQQFGIRVTSSSSEQLASRIKSESDGRGADAIYICAGGKKAGLIDTSLQLIRDRGKIVIVGDIQPDFTRSLMFQKEAQILISRAGGPGRYDPSYEQEGIDYPIGYIRWTEGRNMQEYIRLLAERRIEISPLITHEANFAQVKELFQLIEEQPLETLGVLFHYRKAVN